MHTLFLDPLLQNWTLNGEYAAQLVADLDDAQTTLQPVPAMNHPAWILSHLCVYHTSAADLLRGRTPDDPRGHRYGMNSVPLADPSAYLPRAELVASFSRGHADVADALRSTTEEVLTRPMSVERWRARFPFAGSILP